MRPLCWTIPLALLAAGCNDGEQIDLAPNCAAALPATGFPGAGVIHIDAPIPTGPITPAAHRGAPPLDVDDAVVMTSPRVVTLVAGDDPMHDTLFQFSDDIVSSKWWPVVAAEFGVGPLRPSVNVTAPSQPGTMTDTDLIDYAKKNGPPPDGNTIYLIYLSPSVELVYNGQRNCGCAFAAGAHFRMSPSGNDAIAWIQRCSTAPDSMTVTASHEILESATDPGVSGGYVESPSKQPWTGTVWAAIQDGANELADLCEGTRIHEGAWEYQRSFSNTAAMKGDDFCAPALDEPYYNVTVDQDWYSVPSGGSVDIEMTGWATAPMEDWFVLPRLASATQLGFKTDIKSDESASSSGLLFYGINNGKKATLTVTAPEAPSGTYAVVRILSRLSSPGSDTTHFWPVGVVIQ